MPGANVNWPTPLIRQPPWFPGQFGVPGTDSETGLRLNSEGCIFWVDPNHVDANDNRDGTDPTAPLRTVTTALTKCEAYRGDTIAVMHNGLWTYGSPLVAHLLPIQEAVIVNVPGVRIVGVSPSPLGVPWVPTANSDVLITVHQTDVLIEGFCFHAYLYTGNVGVACEWDAPPFGESTVIRHNYFYDLNYCITLDYSWNCYIEDNRFDNIGGACIYNAAGYGDPDYTTIRNNIFLNSDNGVVLEDCDFCLIEGNRFMDAGDAIEMVNGDFNTIHANTIQGTPAGVNNFIDLTGGASNLVSDNWLACTIAQYDTTCSDATSGSWVNNHCTNGDPTAPPV